MKIAILGANGQVGAELCLILARQPGVEIVPICRSRMGSAFLRFKGLRCRHGQPSEPHSARQLYGDCDVILNLALVPEGNDARAARRLHRLLISNVAECTKPGAIHIYFSTMSV